MLRRQPGGDQRRHGDPPDLVVILILIERVGGDEPGPELDLNLDLGDEHQQHVGERHDLLHELAGLDDDRL